MISEKRRKRRFHLYYRSKIWFLTQLDRVDKIPSFFRFPLGVLLLIVGSILFLIPLPFTNGSILMLIGARMLGKKYINFIFYFLEPSRRKTFSSSEEALFALLDT